MTARHARRYGTANAKGSQRAAAWLAVLAVLAQAVLFEFAMAARDAAETSGQAAAGTHHAHHGAPAQGPQGPGHDHGKDCPFCLARATHAAPGLPSAPELPLPASAAAVASPLAQARVRARRRPGRFRSRSPPREPRD